MKILIVFLLVILLYSCDKKQSQEKDFNSQHVRIYQKSNDIIWEKINNYLTEKNIEPKLTDKEKGNINFEMKIAGSLVNKYTTFTLPNKFSKLENVVYSVYIIIKPIGNDTELEIISSFNGVLEIEKVGFKGQYTEKKKQKLVSSGSMEKEMLDYFDK